MSDLIDPAAPFDLFALGAELKAHQWGIHLHPKQWAGYPNGQKLAWSAVKFSRANRKNVPAMDQGVYSFVVKPEVGGHPANSVLLYVGKTEKQGFQKRFMQYFGERDTKSKKKQLKRPKVRRFLLAFPRNLWFYYAPVDDVSKIDQIEKDLIRALLPVACDDKYPAEVKSAIKALEN